MLDDNTILQHSPGLGEQNVLPDGLVIQMDDKVHTMNMTAREIFELFDGSRRIGEIVSELTGRYPDSDDVSDHVRNFIAQLHENGLLTEE